MDCADAEPIQGSLAAIDFLIASALRNQNAGDFGRAEEAYQQLVLMAPGWAEARNNLGTALMKQGKLAEAAAQYEMALTLKPDFAEIHYNLGNVLKEQGRLNEAADRYEKAIALKPDYADARNNLGITLQQLKKLDEAAVQFERVLAVNPDNAEACNNLGIVLKEQGKFTEAKAQYEKAFALKPDFAEAHNNLGVALQHRMKLDEAAAQFERALAIEPDYAIAHNNLGTVFKDQGKFSEATAQYEKALAHQPDLAEAHYNRAEILTFRRGDANLAALEALAAGIDRLPEGKRPYIHFALAKALDDIGDYDRAFAQMMAGNAFKRRDVDYDEAGTQDYFRLISEVFEPGLFDRLQGAGEPSSVPIFVLGMPRSGSTLIEQILASHPDVHGAGELDNLNRVANSGAIRYPGSISGLDADGLRRLGEAYLAGLPELLGGKTRITDKSPLNFLHIGLIRLILPNARIIHTVRDPVDNCVSCFSKLFTFEMKFSYSLPELGRYYRYYSVLMAHWRSALPANGMLDVRYEDVVDNLEEQARRLLDYCGLSWDDRCLSFYKTSRPVASASAVQVRQPLFRSSLKRWRRYKDYLQPLLAELDGPGKDGA